MGAGAKSENPSSALEQFMSAFDRAGQRIEMVSKVSRAVVRAKAREARAAVRSGEVAVSRLKRLFSI